MKQCTRCLRLMGNALAKCLYCRCEELQELSFGSPSLSQSFRLFTAEIRVDDTAYSIVRPLGKGGFGTVLQVVDSADGRAYAMKVPLQFDEVFTNNQANRPEEIETSQKFLENEINTIQHFKDETFLYIHRRGTARALHRSREVQFPVFLMELAEGTVDSLIRQEAEGKLRIPPAEKAKILKESVGAIAHLHAMNVIHRDLSPDNLFMVDRGGKVSYVLGDFGSSKRLVELKDTSRSTKIVAHTAYLDPLRYGENFRYDFRTDVYSLGVIFTEVLLGRSWLKTIGEANIPHLAAVDFEHDFLRPYAADQISPALLETLAQATRRDPDERFATVEEFRDSLIDALDLDREHTHTPVFTPPPPPVATQTLEWEFRFTLPLPTPSTNDTMAQTTREVSAGGQITLADFRGVRLTIRDFTPQRAEIHGTTLYSVTVAGQAILLNFRGSEWQKLQLPLTLLPGDTRGEFTFQAILHVEGTPHDQ